jgi:DNA polymerase I-like protein with 3'-5' exonuclease and polymerase domains
MIPNGIILTEQDLQQVVDYYLTQDSFSFDTEASYDNRLNPNVNTLTWISLATHGSTVVVPMSHPRGEETGTTTVPAQYGGTGPRAGKWFNKTVKLYSDPPEQLDAQTVFSILKPLFASTTITKCGYGMLYDLLSVAKYLGFVPLPPYFDPLVGFWMLDENRFTRGLKEMTEVRYDFKYDFENTGACVEDHPFSKVAWYSFCDAKFTFLHMYWIKQQLEKEELIKPFEFEMEVLNVLVGMRMAGVQVDVLALERLRDELTVKLMIAETQIYQAAGRKFNINSNHDKQDLLYGPVTDDPKTSGQGLVPWKLTDSGKEAKSSGKTLTFRHYSVDDDVLSSYNNIVCEALRDHGDINKVLSTYVNGWLGTDKKPSLITDGRLYPTLKQYGTKTGRLASSAPNAQNLPVAKSQLGNLVRSVFTAEPGNILICADFNQIELVVLAHYIGQGALFEGFQQNIDPHRMTAALIYGVEPDKVTGEQRRVAKTVNFAVVYGAGINKVAVTSNLSLKDTKSLLKAHQQQFPEIYEFKQDVIEYARSRKPQPYIRTLLGRKRRVPDLLSKESWLRARAERQLFNSIFQGGAADICLKAMIRLDAMLPDEAKLLLQVHDELLVSGPKDMEEELVRIVTEAMTGKGIQKLINVPLKIDLHTGPTWAEIKN